jgi:hypothetical protein
MIPDTEHTELRFSEDRVLVVNERVRVRDDYSRKALDYLDRRRESGARNPYPAHLAGQEGVLRRLHSWGNPRTRTTDAYVELDSGEEIRTSPGFLDPAEKTQE